MVNLPSHIQYKSKGSIINHYHFQKAGDVMPLHNHPSDHDIIVIAGRAMLNTPHYGNHEIPKGHIVTVHTPHPHGITALEDNTHTIHTFHDPDYRE